MSTNREKSSPFVDMTKMIKQMGYNRDVTLTMGTVTDTAPLTVQLKGNGLETQNLKPMAHLMPQYLPAHILFGGELGSQNVTIMIDNGLEVGDVVYIIYEIENNAVKGFILGKEE